MMAFAPLNAGVKSLISFSDWNKLNWKNKNKNRFVSRTEKFHGTTIGYQIVVNGAIESRTYFERNEKKKEKQSAQSIA